jgi:maleylacetoacetate isomerase
VDEDQSFLQSLSILEYLEERYPAISLLPENIVTRSKVRAFAQAIACDIHPLNNLRVLKYLQNDLSLSDEQKKHWYQHWIIAGFNSLEAQLQDSNGQFCFGTQPTFADCCLIPQVYNAKRFKIDLSAFAKIESISQHCLTLPAFFNAAPEQQPDWE